jgi:hypothetical protein
MLIELGSGHLGLAINSVDELDAVDQSPPPVFSWWLVFT